MPRITTPLSDTQIRAVKPRAKEFNLADGNGLYIRVRPNGSKVWIFNYSKPITKRRANICLGKYPTLGLSHARAIRDEYRSLLYQGVDPKQHREHQDQFRKDIHETTFKYVFKEWLEVKKGKVSQDYAKDIESSMNLHILPYMGDVPIQHVRARPVIEILQPIARRGSLETVKRLCQRLNEVLTYAVNTGLADNNPLLGIKAAFESPSRKSQPALRPEELPILMHSLAQASIRRTTRCLIEFQLHTMVRPGEAAAVTWSEIDFETALWTIPAHRMKRKKEHKVPLSSQVVILLDSMKPLSLHREYIFPSERNPRTHSHAQTANMALKRMGFKGKLVAHGLRSIASTTLNEKGFAPDIVEAALAHGDSDKTRAAYNRAEYLDMRREMMAWWSDHISTASRGSYSLAENSHMLSNQEAE